MTEEQQWEFWLTSAAQELEHIADITAKMAMVGSANPTNPRFVAVMDRHRHLVTRTEEILDRLQSIFPASK